MKKIKAGQFECFPQIKVDGVNAKVFNGLSDAVSQWKQDCKENKNVITIECYPGVNQQELAQGLQALGASLVIHSDDLAFEPEKMDEILERDLLPHDPVFGIMTVRTLKDFFYEERLAEARRKVQEEDKGIVVVYGVGASLVHPGDIQVLADITRWEIQLRYRRGMTNWRTAQKDLPKKELV